MTNETKLETAKLIENASTLENQNYKVSISINGTRVSTTYHYALKVTELKGNLKNSNGICIEDDGIEIDDDNYLVHNNNVFIPFCDLESITDLDKTGSFYIFRLGAMTITLSLIIKGSTNKALGR